jgi:hypothetical protein
MLSELNIRLTGSCKALDDNNVEVFDVRLRLI